MSVNVSREHLSLNLRTYGEDQLAEQVLGIDAELMARIGERADHYLSAEHSRRSGASMPIATAVSLAAVDVLEGASRPLRWKRRRIKGIYPGY